MKDYKTDNILIMNCSLDMAKSIILFRNELSTRSPLEIPSNWPSYRFISFLPLLIEDLENKIDSHFYMWILAELINKKMIGDILLYKNPKADSTVHLEIRYLSLTAEKKYFKESIKLFLKFVMKQFDGLFNQVNIEVLYTDNFKIETLKRLGFKLKKREHPYLIWSYSLP